MRVEEMIDPTARAWYEAGMRDAETRLSVEFEARLSSISERASLVEDSMGEFSGMATCVREELRRERNLRRVWQAAAISYAAITVALGVTLWWRW